MERGTSHDDRPWASDADPWAPDADLDPERRARAERRLERRARRAARTVRVDGPGPDAEAGRGEGHDGAHGDRGPGREHETHDHDGGHGARGRARRLLHRAVDVELLRSRWGRALAGTVGVLAVLTVVGLVALWPGGGDDRPGRDGRPALIGPTIAARATTVTDAPCSPGSRQTCRSVVATIGEGPDAGRRFPITLGGTDTSARVSAGQAIRVQRAEQAGGASTGERYLMISVDRRAPMLWLGLAFAGLIVLLARWRGVLAIAGFALSLVLVAGFMVPAVSAGTPPLLVALVGGLAVMFVTVGLTYGIRGPSLAAALGIAISLFLAALLGVVIADAAHLDGRSTELASDLHMLGSTVSMQGVVIAGITLSALGVLADMAVTQASAVMAIRGANPSMSLRRVYSSALGVGRDHLVATTHTLVLAYVGATLPLLLFLHLGGVGTVDAINTEDVAEPIVATLIGAIALLVSVPLTTALSTLLVAPLRAGEMPDAGHGHHHH